MRSQSDKLLDQIYRYLRELESGKIKGLKGHGGGSHRSESHHRGGNFAGNKNKRGKTVPTNEIKRGAQRVKKYRKLSGKMRIDKETKEALLHFTAKQVYKANTTKNIKKVINKRFDLFNKRYDVENKTEAGVKYALKYLTPAQAAKYLGATPKEPDEWEEHYFAGLKPPKVDWYDFPSYMQHWSRKNGSFLYNNQGIVFDEGNNSIWEDLLVSGVDGYDHSLYEWFMIMTPRKRSGWLFDPVNFNDIFWVKQEEWEKVQTLEITDDAYLDPDFYNNRKYYIRKSSYIKPGSRESKDNEYLASLNNIRDATVSSEDTVYDSDEWDY